MTAAGAQIQFELPPVAEFGARLRVVAAIDATSPIQLQMPPEYARALVRHLDRIEGQEMRIAALSEEVEGLHGRNQMLLNDYRQLADQGTDLANRCVTLTLWCGVVGLAWFLSAAAALFWWLT